MLVALFIGAIYALWVGLIWISHPLYKRVTKSKHQLRFRDAALWALFSSPVPAAIVFALVMYSGSFKTRSAAPPPPEAQTAAPSEKWSLQPGMDETQQSFVIDRILESMDLGNIAFNTPESMNLEETATIQLKLSSAASIDELKRAIEVPGPKEGARIRVSDRMEAKLEGDDFTIKPLTHEIQAISRRETTEWMWAVKPTSAGPHKLYLAVSALLLVDGQVTPRTIRTFGKEIKVQVHWHQRAAAFINKNWQWLWTTLLVPVVGWIWKNKKRTKSIPE
jgi:hypothetical protein